MDIAGNDVAKFHALGGMELPSLVPTTTTNRLYNNAGTLYWNGSAVGGGGSTTTINNNADNRIITGSNTADTLNGEANLTFDGSTLGVTGSITASGSLTVTGSSTAEDAIKTTNGRLQLGSHSSGAGIWLGDSNSTLRGFIGFTNDTDSTFRFWRGSNKFTVDASGNGTFTGTLSAGNVINGSAYQVSGTEVINSSRNLTNIGTISSGDITITDTSADPFLKLATSEREYVVRIDNSDSDKFQIRDVTASATRITLNSSGNVGIGTSSPAVPFHVASNNGAIARFANNSATDTTSYITVINANDTSNGTVVAHISDGTSYIGNQQNNALRLVTNDTERFRITSGGDFQVGSTPVTFIDQSRNLQNIASLTIVSSSTSSTLKYGANNSRTFTKSDAGATASQSGFFETSSPTNYYSGASSWQHLMEARHSNNSNNYAMQIAGSFFDQDFYGRKTNNLSTTAWRKFCLEDTSGNLTVTGNITAYSDERLKDNIQTLDGSKVFDMRGVSFTKDNVDGSGVIAQEIEKIAPELVHTADDDMGTKSVAYGNLVGYLIEAVKELKAEIEELKK
jgi:hypothetical protein